MTNWLNPALDRTALAATYASNRHVRIANVLVPDKAAQVAQSLSEIGEWSLLCGSGSRTAIIDPNEIPTWTPEKQAELQTTLANAARGGQGFAFLGYRMDDRWAGGAPDTPLGHFYDAMLGEELLGFVGDVTGKRDLRGVSAQATRFGPSHYLTRHRDDPAQEQRRLAFVWGFTPQWHPDWGGLLQFYTEGGAPTMSFPPGFNCLDVFEIDNIHSVTFIAPFAGAVRQVVSGWYLANQPNAAS